MSKRGRKSADELKVTVNIPQRPDAPADLTPRQAEIWKEAVNQYAVDWFPKETHALLAAYCRHCSTSEDIANRIKAMNPMEEDTQIMDRLYRMQDRESQAIARTATKLRMTPQSKYDPITAARKNRGAGKETQGGAEVWNDY